MTDADATNSCCSSSSCCGGDPGTQTAVADAPKASAARRLDAELLVIDLDSCTRCVPTGEQLRAALQLIAPIAETLDIGLTYRETVVQSVAEAKARTLLSRRSA